MEDEFDLHYTLEFNRETFVVQSEVWCVKLGREPSVQKLKRLFEQDPYVQFVAKTKGDFNLIIKVITESNESYVNWSMRTMIKLLPYKLDFEPSQVLLIHSGLRRIPGSLITRLSLRDSKLDMLDKKILEVLTINSRLNYKDIARKLGKDVETIRYRMSRIASKKIIRRFTVIARKPPTPWNVVFFMKCKFAPGVAERYIKAARYYLDSESQLRIINKFQYLSLTSGSHNLFGIGCFGNEEEALKDVLITHREIYRKDDPTILLARITEVIKGELPVRNIDFGKEYKSLILNRQQLSVP